VVNDFEYTFIVDKASNEMINVNGIMKIINSMI